MVQGLALQSVWHRGRARSRSCGNRLATHRNIQKRVGNVGRLLVDALARGRVDRDTRVCGARLQIVAAPKSVHVNFVQLDGLVWISSTERSKHTPHGLHEQMVADVTDTDHRVGVSQIGTDQKLFEISKAK